MADVNGETVTLQGDEAVATLPEGNRTTMKLADLLERMAPSLPDTAGAILPDGVKYAKNIAGGLLIVHQSPPRVHGFRWIADDSAAEFGPGTRYRQVRLALPYVIVLAVFARTGRGVPTLTERNECFFSNQPLEVQGLDTPLAYPALLNCSKMSENGMGLLSWLCTQHLPRSSYAAQPSLEASIREGLAALLRHLLESGFNRSSEHNEGASGFSASVGAAIDPRIASVADWEKATRDDPLFVLDVSWLATGKTLGEITRGVSLTGRRGGRGRRFTNAADVARLMFNAAHVEGKKT